MDGSLPALLRQTKETVHWRTGPCNAWPYETFSDQMWCFKICLRSSAHPTGLEQRLTPLCLHLQNILAYQEELWNLWLGVISDHSGTGGMETLHSRVPTHNSQSDLLQRSKEIEQKTSMMVALPVRIQCQAYPHFGQQNGSIWCTLS